MNGKYQVLRSTEESGEQLPPKKPLPKTKKARPGDDVIDLTPECDEIPVGTKIEAGDGIVLAVANDGTIKNKFGETIMEKARLQEYVKQGLCKIIPE
jgi:hypothetical protein